MKISKQFLEHYAKYSLFNLKESTSKDTKKSNLCTSMCFSEVILISFVMLNNKKKRHLEKEMHEIHGGSNFRPYDDYGISLPSVGQHLMFAFSLAHRGSAGGFL